METFEVKGGGLEVWKDIQGYEGIYQVSTHGEVKSLSRQLHNKNGYFTSKEKMLKPRLSGRDEKNKYVEVALYKNHKRQDVRIHRLVAEAFIPNPNSYQIINHKDGNKKNNNVTDATYGLSLPQLADFMRYYGVYSGANFDGGGSTQLITKNPVTDQFEVTVHSSDYGENSEPYQSRDVINALLVYIRY